MYKAPHRNLPHILLPTIGGLTGATLGIISFYVWIFVDKYLAIFFFMGAPIITGLIGYGVGVLSASWLRGVSPRIEERLEKLIIKIRFRVNKRQLSGAGVVALFLIGLTFAIAACTTIGKKFDPDKVDDLKPGISTIADATAILGPPAFQSRDSDGSRLLQWQYTRISAFSGLSGADIGILFDDTGRMIRVTHSFVQTK